MGLGGPSEIMTMALQYKNMTDHTTPRFVSFIKHFITEKTLYLHHLKRLFTVTDSVYIAAVHTAGKRGPNMIYYPNYVFNMAYM